MKKLSEILAAYRIDRPDEWTMDMLREKAEKLEAERDALAEQVKQLTTLCLAYEGQVPFPQLTKELFEPSFKALHVVSEIRAEAGRAGFVAGYHSGYGDKVLNRSFSPEWRASSYAADM